MDIRVVVASALTKACVLDTGQKEPKRARRDRSTNFVRCLADEFRDRVPKGETTDGNRTYVLSKDCEGNRKQFGMNELLFDVLVCKCGSAESPKHKKKLTYVQRCVWAVESEMKRSDTAAAFIDFNKLVLSSAENKLFVGPRQPGEKTYLEKLREPAKFVSNALYLALIPHPDTWDAKALQPVQVYQWRDDNWTPI